MRLQQGVYLRMRVQEMGLGRRVASQNGCLMPDCVCNATFQIERALTLGTARRSSISRKPLLHMLHMTSNSLFLILN